MYWIGGTGKWTNGMRWAATSGGPACNCLPTIQDNVVFDANSFAASGHIVTLNDTAYCWDMTWTIDVPVTLTGNSPVSIHGSMVLSPLLVSTNNGRFHFRSSSLGNTVTTANITINCAIDFDGEGSWALMDSLKTAYGVRDLYFKNGTLNTNDQYISIGRFLSSGNLYRDLQLGSSTIVVRFAPNYSASWIFAGDNAFLNAGTSHIILLGIGNDNYFNARFEGGGMSYARVTFTHPNGTAYIENDGPSNHFTCLTFLGHGRIFGQNSMDTLTLTQGSSYLLDSVQIINEKLNGVGSCGLPIRLSGGGFYSDADSMLLQYAWMTNFIAEGTSVFNATNSMDVEGNIGWEFEEVQPKTLYRINGSGSWNDPNKWSLSSGGPPAGCIPTKFDDVVFDEATSEWPSITVTHPSNPYGYCNDFLWMVPTSNIGTLQLGFASQLYVYGSLMLSEGVTITGPTYNLPVIRLRSNAQDATLSGGIITNASIWIEGTGTYTLLDSLTLGPGSLLLRKGGLHTNGQFIQTRNFHINSSYLGGSRSLDLGASHIEVTYEGSTAWYVDSTQLSFNAGTSVIRHMGANAYFHGGGLDYHILEYTNPDGWAKFSHFSSPHKVNTFHKVLYRGNGHIGDHIIDKLVLSPGKTYWFWSTQPITDSLIAIGTADELITIKSWDPAYLNIEEGVVCVEHCIINNVNATGGAQFRAANSVDMGNTAGWNFVACMDQVMMSYDSTLLCPGAEVTYHNASEGIVVGQEWTFSGGIPSTSTDPSPVVIYPEVGSYEVTLTTYFTDGAQTLSMEGFMQITDLPEMVVVDTGEGLLAIEGVEYQWLDCNNADQPIEGATEQMFVPTVSGSYAVQVSTMNCQATSDCFPYFSTSIMGHSSPDLSLMPNPNTGKFTLVVPKGWMDYQVRISDASGRTISSMRSMGLSTEFKILESPGLYFLSVNSHERTAVLRFVIQAD
ncbi:MAG: T9SS type A sorting domain-containing protein [Bacteroidota bacterium]|nr:T9SS type A sorting domain-containing protein [Bacteroidota bacterium]